VPKGDPDFGYIHAKNELCDYDDQEAIEVFERGYSSERDLDMKKSTRQNYEALSVLFSVQAGKWLENRDVDFIDSYAENVEDRAKEYLN